MTLEELQKALQEGKKVTKDNGDTYLKIEDGRFTVRDGKAGCLLSTPPFIVFRPDAFLKNNTGYELYKKPILDEEEKKYLSNIIRPFRKKYKIMIQKNHSIFNSSEYIYIYLKHDKLPYNNFDLPLFKEGEMYKGMELNKEYSLEELGL